ncbi:hypothetical protein EJ08DRAFT_637336 [Tothia fuscella]|uniref:Mediator of RNA polymerase II transcription subunit 12 n=1 Tax=Tothia fuscella TaxID=1048955 RepID=A0A9P4NMZ0_9PEZI|nr:hypothetical protein EJ08DRAFT_637336 [Tothia fuscella]
MTSRPAVGSQQPPQRSGGRSRAAIQARSVQANAANNARRPGLSVDLTGSTGAFGFGDLQSLSGGSAPGTPVFEFTNRLGNGARGGKQQHGSSDGASSPQIVGNERVQAGLPPRPGRPAFEQNTKPQERPGSQPNWPKDETKVHTYDPPPAAQLFPGGKTTDFYPWNGTHIEDSLTEQTVKSGFSIKSLVTNETNTARPSLWTHMKKPGGTQTLSQLFVTVFERRQAALSLNSPSTFKPPPRVTLTNTKREAWLRDLANPASALRKLNRTIPYGISGKVLLEQCLDKEIPTGRAVWLAKCIGANELRTLKRQGRPGAPGLSGELKWIREWTVHVEQFVSSTMSGFGEENWKNKMQYVMRLVYHLFAEHLLDHEHYLEWILSALESSNIERLPMWLVHTQLYWGQLVKNRKKGKRLADCLLGHLEFASSHQDNDLLQPLLNKMRMLVATLAVSHKGCLILPKRWEQVKSQLEALSIIPEYAAAHSAISTVIARNGRLCPATQSGRPKSSPLSPRRRVFQLLDGIGITVVIEKITSQCLEFLGNVQELVHAVLQWASSIYRQGSHRIYLAARILRRCKALGADIESSILSFVNALMPSSGVDENKISRIVAELVRSKHFAVAHVLQIMIATGSISSATPDSPTAKRLVKLLGDIPTSDSPQHIFELKRILLRSAGLRNFDDSEDVEAMKCAISRRLQTPKALDDLEVADENFHHHLQGKSLSDQLSIAVWVRQEVIDFKLGQPALASGYVSSTQTFLVARDILESIGDVAILADVIGILLKESSMETMASIIDTVHLHYRCFAAVGALQQILKELIENYHGIRHTLSLEKAYLQALADLCTTVGVDESIQQQLSYDLTRCTQRNNIAMCSPASDNAADIISSSSLESDAEIDNILMSGSTMDEQILSRTFKRLVVRLEEQTTSLKPKSLRCGQWFLQLRTFDENAFDGLMREYLSSEVFISNPARYRQVLPPLIGSECLALNTFVQIVGDCAQMLGGDENTLRLELGMLEAVLATPARGAIANIPELYKFRLEQLKFALQSPNTIQEQLQKQLLWSDFIHIENITEVIASDPVLQILHHAVVNADRSLGDFLAISAFKRSDGTRAGMEDVLDKLLDPTDRFKLSTLSQTDQLVQLGQIADDLSLPFCQLAIQYRLCFGSDGSANNIPKAEFATMLFGLALYAEEERHLVWIELIAGLASDTLLEIRRLAGGKVLTHIKESIHAFQSQNYLPDGAKIVEDQRLMRRLMCIVQCTSTGISNDESLEGVHAVAESLQAIAASIGILDASGSNMNEYTNNLAHAGACHHIDALLHLLVLHKSLAPTSTHKTNSAEQAAVLHTLCALFTHPHLESVYSTCEYMFDVATYLSDDLPDDTRSNLSKTERKDPRISFLFDSITPTDGWLGLVISNHNVLQPPGSISGPNTPPARFGTGQQQAVGARMQQQRAPALQWHTSGSQHNSQKSFHPPVPFPLRRWELLPDHGNNTTANDTALSLSLFGARKSDSQS